MYFFRGGFDNHFATLLFSHFLLYKLIFYTFAITKTIGCLI